MKSKLKRALLAMLVVFLLGFACVRVWDWYWFTHWSASARLARYLGESVSPYSEAGLARALLAQVPPGTSRDAAQIFMKRISSDAGNECIYLGDAYKDQCFVTDAPGHPSVPFGLAWIETSYAIEFWFGSDDKLKSIALHKRWTSL